MTTAEPPMGSLMDDVLPEEGGGWRPYELPRELSDARVQERLAEYIVGVVRGGGGLTRAAPAVGAAREVWELWAAREQLWE